MRADPIPPIHCKPRKLFTAAQIAAVLGCTRQRVLQLMTGAQVSGHVTVRGQKAKGWAVADLPPGVREQLATLATRHGARSIEHLLESHCGPWMPPIPLGEIDPVQFDVARALCEHLAPILSQIGDRAPVSEIARRAIASLGPESGFNERGVRGSIERAIERDRGREEWTRPELFLEETLRQREAGCGVGRHSLFDDLLPKTLNDLWPVACAMLKRETAAGADPRATKRAILAALRMSPLTAGMSAGAVRMQFERKFERLLGEGAIKDKRGCNQGRPAKFKLSDTEADALRNLVLEKESLPLAIEDFVRCPECSADTRAMILAELDRAAQRRRPPQWPRSLRRAAHIGEDIEAEFRGRKHAQAYEVIERRGMWYADEAGAAHAMEPNTLWESDDMSLNEPFRYVDPGFAFSDGTAGERPAIQIGRQTLCTLDVFSGAWLGVSPVGRERDAYRIEDIADHMADTVAAHGLPLIWRLERGPWENSFVDGVRLDDGTKWGGLDGIIRIVHGFKSRTKGLIESSFDLLQSLTAHRSTTIGRKRGEFERATKLFLKAGKGDEGAAARFWDISQAADGMCEAMERFNNRPKQRRAFGRDMVVPADLYSNAAARRCPADEEWRFCPIKRAATVRAGVIETTVPHYPVSFRFRVNGDGVYLEHGYAVLIAFHPGHPYRGCHVFNAERGVRNRDGLRFGEFILNATMTEDAPQLNLNPDNREHLARKNANAAVRSEFRAIRRAGNGAAPVGQSASRARDGYGNSAEMDNFSRRNEPAKESPGIKAIQKAYTERAQQRMADDLAAREDELIRGGEFLT
ncbi:MAG: hypothetical protein ABSE62_15990 [Chthoniobacteraceae bacterium]